MVSSVGNQIVEYSIRLRMFKLPTAYALCQATTLKSSKCLNKLIQKYPSQAPQLLLLQRVVFSLLSRLFWFCGRPHVFTGPLSFADGTKNINIFVAWLEN